MQVDSGMDKYKNNIIKGKIECMLVYSMSHTLTGNVPGGSFVVRRSLRRWIALTLFARISSSGSSSSVWIGKWGESHILGLGPFLYSLSIGIHSPNSLLTFRKFDPFRSSRNCLFQSSPLLIIIASQSTPASAWRIYWAIIYR